MFTGHVSLHLRWNSCLKTQSVHPLDCNNLPYAGLYIVAGTQLRPCGQRRPDSWVNLSLFISVTWVEARRASSSLSPVTEREHCEPHRWSHLQGGFKPVSHFDSLQQWQTRCGPNSAPDLPSAAMQWTLQAPFYLFQNKIKQAKKLLEGLCFWTYSKGSQTLQHLRQPHKPVRWQQ